MGSKRTEYPTRGMEINDCYEDIKIIFKHGGTIKRGTLAELKKLAESGGHFRNILSTLTKYGLIIQEQDEISLTPLAIKILNAYNDKEKKELLFETFITIPLFNEVINKYKDTGLDIENLEKLLIREHNVNPKHAKDLNRCIVNSLNFLGILDKVSGKIDINFVQKELNKMEEETEVYDQIETLKDDNGIKVKDAKKLRKIIGTPKLNTSIYSLNENVLELIKILASHLDPIIINAEEMSNIIEKNGNLRATNFLFKALKKDIEDGILDKDKLEILLEALIDDLKSTISW